jgi:hypothetical protein
MPLQSLYSGVFNINQGVTLTIPGNATNIGVLIQGYTGITDGNMHALVCASHNCRDYCQWHDVFTNLHGWVACLC